MRRNDRELIDEKFQTHGDGLTLRVFNSSLFQLGADMFSDIYFPLLSYKPRARSLPGHYRSTSGHRHRSRQTPMSMYCAPPQPSRHFYPIHSYHSPSQSSLNSSYLQPVAESSALNYLYASSNHHRTDFDVTNDHLLAKGLLHCNASRKTNRSYCNESNKENFDGFNCKHPTAEPIYHDPLFDGSSISCQPLGPNDLNCYTIYEENFGAI